MTPCRPTTHASAIRPSEPPRAARKGYLESEILNSLFATCPGAPGFDIPRVPQRGTIRNEFYQTNPIDAPTGKSSLTPTELPV